jgi:hypothetical protein
MKTLINSFRAGLAVLAFISLYSCEKKSFDSDSTGTAEFFINVPDGLSQTKSGTAGDTAQVSYQIMISVEDMAGIAVFTDKLIPLYTFGTGFVSENIEIKAGEFRLTKFMVINPAGAVIFASPREGSPLAYLTTRPLPFNFSISPNQVTKILPEVLAAGDQTPEKFGYASFGVQIIKPLSFWTGAVIDNPMIMAPFPQFTEATLTVFSNDGWHYTFKLVAGVNNLVIRGGSANYIFILEKTGYLPVKSEYSSGVLLAATKENPLYLKIPWDSQAYKTLTLQPGPDAGKDAMVSNLEPDKNFGDYKYFEATFLSEPVLTVMRSNRSMIWFDLNQLPKSAIIKKVILTLRYDIPIPWDLNVFPTATPGSNLWYGAVLQQVIEPWEEGKVTWNTQPKSTELNQVFLSPFIKNANAIEIDVTRLYLNPAANALPNYGMLFRLFPTEKFPGFRFASSDYPDVLMRPRLIVYYTVI